MSDSLAPPVGSAAAAAAAAASDDEEADVNRASETVVPPTFFSSSEKDDKGGGATFVGAGGGNEGGGGGNDAVVVVVTVAVAVSPPSPRATSTMPSNPPCEDMAQPRNGAEEFQKRSRCFLSASDLYPKRSEKKTKNDDNIIENRPCPPPKQPFERAHHHTSSECGSSA